MNWVDRRSTTGVERKAQPSTGGRKAYAYFSTCNANSGKAPLNLSNRCPEQVTDRVEKGFHENSKDSEVSHFSTNFSTTFPPIEETSEREESEGVGEGFTPEKVLTREESSNFLLDASVPSLNGHADMFWQIVNAHPGALPSQIANKLQHATGRNINGAQAKALIAQGPPVYEIDPDEEL